MSIQIIVLFFSHASITLVICVDNLFLSLSITLSFLQWISTLFGELVLLETWFFSMWVFSYLCYMWVFSYLCMDNLSYICG
jgi:hypothetical protein